MNAAIVPILSEVAARLDCSGATLQDAPRAWAYALRDVVEIVQPAWIVTHHDPMLERHAIATSGIEVDEVVDLALAETPAVASAVAVTEVLAGCYPDRPIAASITGPGALARSIADGPAGADLLLDLGDALAALAYAYIAAGATRLLVWEEPCDTAAAAADLRAAHAPMLRRLALLDVPAVLCGPQRVGLEGYEAEAWLGGGHGAGLFPPDAFTGPVDGEVLAPESAPGVLISDGPVAAASDLGRLRTATTSGALQVSPVRH